MFLSVQESLDLLTKYPEHVSEHQIKDIAAGAVAGELSKQLSVYARANSYTITYPTLNIHRPFTTDLQAAESELKKSA